MPNKTQLTVWFSSSPLLSSSEQLSPSSPFAFGTAVLSEGGPQVRTKYSFLLLVLLQNSSPLVSNICKFQGPRILLKLNLRYFIHNFPREFSPFCNFPSEFSLIHHKIFKNCHYSAIHNQLIISLFPSSKEKVC